MSISIVHEGTFLTHESGSKFYEVMQLHAPDAGKHLVIKRWGKTGSVSRGGEIQIITCTSARKAASQADSIIRQKEGRGYRRAPSTRGLHGYGGAITIENIRRNLESHYSMDATATIMAAFGIDELFSGARDEPANPIVVEVPEPAPEPERGETWGSW